MTADDSHAASVERRELVRAYIERTVTMIHGAGTIDQQQLPAYRGWQLLRVGVVGGRVHVVMGHDPSAKVEAEVDVSSSSAFLQTKPRSLIGSILEEIDLQLVCAMTEVGYPPDGELRAGRVKSKGGKGEKSRSYRAR